MAVLGIQCAVLVPLGGQSLTKCTHHFKKGRSQRSQLLTAIRATTCTPSQSPQLAAMTAEYQPGEVVWSSAAAASPAPGGGGDGGGIFVVVSGVASRQWLPRGESAAPAQERREGIGGLVGLLWALRVGAGGGSLAGDELVVAQGNGLGRGPLLFHLPQVREGSLLGGGRRGQASGTGTGSRAGLGVGSGAGTCWAEARAYSRVARRRWAFLARSAPVMVPSLSHLPSLPQMLLTVLAHSSHPRLLVLGRLPYCAELRSTERLLGGCRLVRAAVLTHCRMGRADVVISTCTSA